jgi:hypothetical protein
VLISRRIEQGVCMRHRDTWCALPTAESGLSWGRHKLRGPLLGLLLYCHTSLMHLKPTTLRNGIWPLIPVFLLVGSTGAGPETRHKLRGALLQPDGRARPRRREWDEHSADEGTKSHLRHATDPGCQHHRRLGSGKMSWSIIVIIIIIIIIITYSP